MKLTTLSKIFLSAALTVSVFSACDKKLDLQPRQSIDANTAIQTAADVEAAVVGAYSVMGGGALYGSNLLTVSRYHGFLFSRSQNNMLPGAERSRVPSK